MKLIKEFIEDNYRLTPLDEITTKTYESNIGDYTGEELIIGGKHTGIIIYYIDYINWLEKNFTFSKK